MAAKREKTGSESEQQTDLDTLGNVWSTQANLVRAFVEKRSLYASLADEVSYILAKRLNENSIQVAAVTARAKSINSFCEKITRKSYNDPMTEITDLAGVRIVYLYKNDRSAIEKLTENEFEVIEKTDKTDEHEADQFGYGALHYLVRVGKGSSGARYDDLKGMICEIQVRTVLQDAWAIIAHHLSYKQESQVPTVLRRKLNSLSGLFETADDQFDRLRTEREAYIAKLRDKVSRSEQLPQKELNLDILNSYLLTRYPGRDDSAPQSISDLLGELQEAGYSTLTQLDDALKKTDGALLEIEKTVVFRKEPGSQHPGYTPAGCVRLCLCIVDDKFLKVRQMRNPLMDSELYVKYRDLLEK